MRISEEWKRLNSFSIFFLDGWMSTSEEWKVFYFQFFRWMRISEVWEKFQNNNNNFGWMDEEQRVMKGQKDDG
jgi:hypothetical protein